MTDHKVSHKLFKTKSLINKKMQYQHGPKFDKSLTKLSDLGPNYMGARKVEKVLEELIV